MRSTASPTLSASATWRSSMRATITLISVSSSMLLPSHASALEDAGHVLERALAEIERHDEAGPGRDIAGERIGAAVGDRAQHLVPDHRLGEVDHDDVGEQVRGLVPAADLGDAQ